MKRAVVTGWMIVLGTAALLAAWQQAPAMGIAPAWVTGFNIQDALSPPSGVLLARQEVRVGDPAPDFTLPDQNRQQVQLSQFRGRPVQLAFYVWAMSPG